MNTTIDNSHSSLTQAIDEITNAKSYIVLDRQDFADMLQSKGETIVITSEATTNESVDFSVFFKETKNKIKETLDGKTIRSAILYLSYPEDYTPTMDDMNKLNIIFDFSNMKDDSFIWGTGENKNNTIKVITFLKIAE